MNEIAPVSPYLTRCGLEPRLEEVMADPLVRLVMARDGITPDDLRDVMNEARSRLLMRSLIQADDRP